MPNARPPVWQQRIVAWKSGPGGPCGSAERNRVHHIVRRKKRCTAADAASEAIARARGVAETGMTSRPASAHLLVPARPATASVQHRGSHLNSKVGAMLGSSGRVGGGGTQIEPQSPATLATFTSASPPLAVGSAREADEGGSQSARPASARTQQRIASAGPLKSGRPGLAAEDSPEFSVTAGAGGSEQASVRPTKYA